MRFTIRDLLWLTVVFALAMSHVTTYMQRPDVISCPCCQSMYEIDSWTRVVENETLMP